ncbi:MAG: VWA domain-containing protein [Acidobacteria bacterium]|nr:VWA domain-containing protein [Acidobacteriota bacterium]
MFLSFMVALLLALGAKGQEEDAPLTIDSNLVVLNVSVRDGRGLHVSGLRQSAFSVLEDGVTQPVSFFAAEETPFAAVILLDSSGSMGSNISLARSAAIRFLDGLRPEDNVAIYRFDSRVHMVQDFSNSRDVNERIFEVKADGMTVLYDAIFKAAEELSKRPEKRRAIIVLSDGADTQSGRSATRALKAASAANAVIYSVDMTPSSSTSSGRQASRAVLKDFAEKTGGTFVEKPGGADLRTAFEAIVKELGVQYTLGYEPLNEKKDGKWRSIELRIARPNLTIRTRDGYYAVK